MKRAALATTVAMNAAGVKIQPSFRKATSFSKKSLRMPTPEQAFLLVRRFLGIVAAIYCVYCSVSSGYWSVRTLYGFIDSSTAYSPYKTKYIQSYLGNGLISSSRLVTQAFKGDTTPRAYSLYLNSNISYSTSGCERLAEFNSRLYSNSFMRWNFDELVAKTSYNLTFLADAELIAPVVDCSFTPIAMGDSTTSRVYYLMRDLQRTDDTFILMVSLSTQDYRLPAHHQLGATALVVLTLIDDMRNKSITHKVALALGYPFEGPNYQVYTFTEVTSEGFLALDSVPVDSATERKKRVLTANRSGFYVDSEESQSNIKNLYWTLAHDPLQAVTKWQWVGTTVLRNAWGWVRYVNFLFAFSTAFNILVLLLVIYRNFQMGKIWIGDAFVSFSSTLLLRGAVIIGIWMMEGFWSLNTFTLRDGNSLGESIGIFYFRQIMHGDLLTIYISLAGLLGIILKERVNPALVVALFELGFQYRLSVIKWFPDVMDVVVTYANDDYISGVAQLPEELDDFSPFLFWSTHHLMIRTRAVFANLFPVFSTFLIILIYAPMRKALRWYYATHSTQNAPAAAALIGTKHKGSLTVFEIATGAALQNRVGLVSDYESCVFIKGLKFASPDGIYCNGFVIANGKWLIRTDDLVPILLMIALRVRFYDVYAYEVTEHTVNQTARLVYPNSLTIRDLLQLNTTLLA